MENENSILLQIDGMGNKLEKPENFKQSYYKNEYQRAFRVTEDIIQQTNLMMEQKPMIYQNQEMCNIIPFIGGRGSGKTSAMLSFAGALGSYYEDKVIYKKNLVHHFFQNRNSNYGYKQHEDVLFTCLDCIDGSLLEPGEDVFKIILAQMYGKFLELDRHGLVKSKSYDYDKRELQKRFDELYRGICQLDEHSKGLREESSITSLRNLSSSLELKNKFAELVQKYIEMLLYEKYENVKYGQSREHFLVIVIDDLDLNIKFGYEMLEKIHRYMMVPYVIVLLAVDYKQLKMLCEKHFFDMIPQVDRILQERSGEADALAQDFLDKVLPFNMRIYMPQFKRYHKLMININDKLLDLKKGIFNEIYKKAGIRFDTQGIKRHFYESNSLRGYVNLYLMLAGMKDLPVQKTEGEDFWLEYEKNYTMLLSDIITRMVDENLDSKSKNLFMNLTDSSLNRNCRSVVFYMKEVWGGNQEKKKIKELVEAIDKYGYSYGELLRTLYCWGRIDNESKHIVRCLMAFLSAEMTHTYYVYRNGSEQEKEKAQGDFLEIFNGSFAGSWTNKMIPSMLGPTGDDLTSRIVKVGAIKDVNMNVAIRFNFRLGDKESSHIRMLRSMVVFAMFFSQPHYKTKKSFTWEFFQPSKASIPTGSGVRERIENDDFVSTLYQAGEGNKDSISIWNKEGKCTFNMFNFVSNTFEWERVVKEVREALQSAIFTDEGEGDILYRGDYDESFSEIENEFEKWERNSGGFVLPVYDLDLSYNIAKRIRQKTYRVQVYAKTSEGILAYYTDVLREIEDMLKLNDMYYGTSLNASASTYTEPNASLQKMYKECPYIKWFLERKEYMVENFDTEFCNMLKRISSTENEISGEEENEPRGYDE